MARAIWSGVLTFGLVSLPIELYTATEAHEPTFHQFQRKTSDRIRYKRVNERTGREVDYSNIVKGASVGRDKYVMLEQDELDSVAPGRSRAMQVETFVERDEIDPIHFAKSYFVGPRDDDTKRIYALLREALAEADRAAIVRFVMRSKEYLAAVRADGDVLVLETMFFADEIRDPAAEISNLPKRVKIRAEEARMARQLIESMTGPWHPQDYRDTYTDRVNKLIRAKRDGREVEIADQPPESTNVTDLTEALRDSLAAQKRRRPDGRKRGGSTKGKSKAKKPA